MKAAVLHTTGEALALDDVEAPTALDYGQVRVKVHYTGICGSQIGEIDAVKGPDKWLPHLLGHEGSGTVLETGEGVTTVAEGDQVVLHWRPGAGIQAKPATYTWRGQKANAGWVTTFQEETVVSENRVTPIPDGIDLQTAPLFGCAVTTGLGVVANDAQVKIGESVVIFGAGGVGLNVVQGAALASANPIVAIDLFDSKLDLARRLGATHLVNSRERDAREAVQAVIGARGADVVIDNTGNPDVMQLAHDLTAPDGRTILVGVMPASKRMSLYTLPLHFGKVLTGSHGGEAQPDRDIPRYADLVNAGKLDLSQLVTNRYEFDQINDAIADLREGRVTGRPLVSVAPA